MYDQSTKILRRNMPPYMELEFPVMICLHIASSLITKFHKKFVEPFKRSAMKNSLDWRTDWLRDKKQYNPLLRVVLCWV